MICYGVSTMKLSMCLLLSHVTPLLCSRSMVAATGDTYASRFLFIDGMLGLVSRRTMKRTLAASKISFVMWAKFCLTCCASVPFSVLRALISIPASRGNNGRWSGVKLQCRRCRAIWRGSFDTTPFCHAIQQCNLSLLPAHDIFRAAAAYNF